MCAPLTPWAKPGAGFCSVLWPFAWRKVMGTAGVTSAVTSPVPLGGNTPAVTNIHLWVWRGRSPPHLQKWDTSSSKSLGWRSPRLLLLQGMDAILASPRNLLCTLCLKSIWVHWIVSQLQQGSLQSCWKERSCWRYGWYLFRAVHCAWQRLPGGADECKTTYADGFNSWECVQLYKIHGEAQILSTFVVSNTSKHVWKCQLIIFRYYYSQKAQCNYSCTHL